MKKTNRSFKTLTAILSVVCILSSILLLSSCKKNKEATDMIFNLNSEGTEYAIAGYKGEEKEITIPGEYKGLPVTSVAEKAFFGNTILESVVLPNSITDIYTSAFEGCTALKSIDLPGTLNSIGYRCFQDCSSLTELAIPEGITKLPQTFVDGCSALETIELPATLNLISYENFFGCDSLKSIKVATGNKIYHSNGNCVIHTADKILVAGTANSVIPADGSVTSIGNFAFFNRQSLKSIMIPSTIQKIGNHAFTGCNSLDKIYYQGTASDWNGVTNSASAIQHAPYATLYFYSETKPTEEGNFWHYTSGNSISTWESDK